MQWLWKRSYKNVDLRRNKIASMQSSWVKRLFEDDFQDWKVIPLFLRGKHLGKNFKFHNRYKQWHLAQILRLTVDLRIFFSDKNVNIIGQLFNDNKNIKLWKNTEFEFHLKDTHKIYWLQIIDALPKTWKNIILKDKGNAKKFFWSPHCKKISNL